MKIGVIFPQTEIGSDPAGVRDYAQAADALGFDHLVVYDHVLGADPGHHENWRGPYTHETLFHEPFVLFGYLAALTQGLELVTGILISPQRQTALIAKQAAEVDVLTGGRLRLGLGSGWNTVEYEALGQDFHSRGKREEEQIALLRALWTEPVVTFKGRFDTVTAAGINPLPIQRPIPIWLGGMSEPVLKRVARLADGWFPQFRPGDEGRAMLERLHGYARQAGRDPAGIGIEGRISAGNNRDPDDWAAMLQAWRDLGATHVSFNTMGSSLTSPAEHIATIERFKQVVGE